MLTEPPLLSFAPLVYVAWADGYLDDAELTAVWKQVQASAWLDEAQRAELGAWLDAERPPTPSQLLGLLRAIREAAAALPESERRSLADLGVAMARAAGEVPEEARTALREVEASLGVLGSERCAALLASPRPGHEGQLDDDGPRFDVAALRALLDGAYAEVRDEMRTYLGERTPTYAISKAEHRERVYEELVELARRGLGRRCFPGVTTDADDLGPFVAAFETLAFGDLSVVVKCGVQFGLFGGSIYFLGSARHHREYLPRIASVELPGCFAMTETGHGSNVMELETVARYLPDSDEIEVHTPRESARKDYIGNAALHGRTATVFAQLEVGDERHGVHAVLVPLRDDDGGALPGVRIVDCGEKIGLHGVDNGRIWFDHVRVPRANLLDRFARIDDEGRYESEIPSAARRFFTMLGTLVAGRVSVAGAAVSAAKVGLTTAVRYAASRRQFGPADEAETRVLDYRTHQRRLLPPLATTYALGFALEDVRRRVLARGEEDDRREVEALAAGVKAYATWHAYDTLQACRECCGGQGYLEANRFGSLKNDTDVFTTFEGDNVVLMQLVAKSLLTEFKDQFAAAPVLLKFMYVAQRAATAITEKNPFTTRWPGTGHLRNREFQLDLLDARVDEMLSTLARRLKKRLDDDVSSFDALVDTQDHVVALARAHIERYLARRFMRVVDGCEDEELRTVLDRLCDLFVLSRFEADAAWLMEHHYFEPSKARAVRAAVNRLCAEVRGDALGLVEAFAVPDSCLGPIAFGDPAHREL